MCLFITKKTYQANMWRTTAVAAYIQLFKKFFVVMTKAKSEKSKGTKIMRKKDKTR